MNNKTSLEFTGDGLEMALLMLKNIFFTIITLGIYRPWATTNMRRYVWGHMNFMGDRANYTGTGGELFRGWIKLIMIIFAGGIVLNLIAVVFPPAAFLLFLVYIVVFALAIYSGLRYRLSRTTWRQIRFGADKDSGMTKDFLKLYFKGAFLSAVTLGIYTPWFQNDVRTFLTGKSRMGNMHFKYDGKGGEYAKIFWLGLVLTVITLGIYTPWFICHLREYRFRHTQFMGRRFGFDMQGGKLLGYALAAWFGTVLTLGLAAPWMYTWGLRLFAKHTFIEEAPDFSLVQNQAADGSAMADDILTGYDLDLGF